MTSHKLIPCVLLLFAHLSTILTKNAATTIVCQKTGMYSTSFESNVAFCINGTNFHDKDDVDVLRISKNRSHPEKKKKGNILFDKTIDNFIRDFELYPWDKSEMQCRSKILNMLSGVRNNTLWATWIWDANAIPSSLILGSTHHYGNYDACLSPPWSDTHPHLKTKYCMADVHLKDQETTGVYNDPYTPMDKYMKTETKYKIKFNAFTWGLCAPVACQPKSIIKFAQSLLKNSHYGFLTPQTNINISSCKDTEEYGPFSNSFIIYMSFVIFSIFLVCASTIYLKLRTRQDNGSIGTKIATSLSLETNISMLQKVGPREIQVLHGIRFLSMLLEIFFHVWFVSDWIGYSDALQFEKSVGDKSFLFHLDIVVDTFFMMAGLLYMRNLLESTNVNLLSVIFKRYVRGALCCAPDTNNLIAQAALLCFGEKGRTISVIAGTEAKHLMFQDRQHNLTLLQHGCVYLMTVVFLSVPHVTSLCSGPMVQTIGKVESDRCEKYWWIGLLTIQNYMNPEKMCCLFTWSLAVDFHMILIGAGLFWLYRKDQRTGTIAFQILIIVSFLLPAMYIYIKNIPGVPFFDMISHRNYSYHFFPSVYMQTHLRMSSFLVGFAFAYLFAKYKPEKHRNVISKRQSILGFIIVIMILLSVLMISGNHYDQEHSAIQSAIFGALNRPLWASAVGLLVSICEYGYIPYVNEFLGARYFVPLSKLSFGIYLNNVLIYVLIKIYNVKTTIQGNMFILVFDTIASAVCSVVVSFLTWLICEAPMNNLVALFINGKI